ncbi:glutamate synthase domain protein, partial [Vibrio parahaemolyticus V-223/04]
RRAPKL